jgi:hypothetical protein
VTCPFASPCCAAGVAAINNATAGSDTKKARPVQRYTGGLPWAFIVITS